MKLSELLLERKEDGVNVDDKGTKRYYRNNVLYREEFADGSKFWYLNGKPHRVDGPAIEWADGTKNWYLNGWLHREDGPAIEWANGDRFWYLNGNKHRADGPAVELANGEKQWYLNGKEYSQADFNKRMK